MHGLETLGNEIGEVNNLCRLSTELFLDPNGYTAQDSLTSEEFCNSLNVIWLKFGFVIMDDGSAETEALIGSSSEDVRSHLDGRNGPAEFKVYKRRWFLLFVLCLLNCSNAMVGRPML